MTAMSREEFEALADEWQQTGGWQLPNHVVSDLIDTLAELMAPPSRCQHGLPIGHCGQPWRDASWVEAAAPLTGPAPGPG